MVSFKIRKAVKTKNIFCYQTQEKVGTHPYPPISVVHYIYGSSSNYQTIPLPQGEMVMDHKSI